MAKATKKRAPQVEEPELDIDAELDELDDEDETPAPKKASKKSKKAPVVEVEDDDEDEDSDEDESEDEDDEDEAPAPKSKKARKAADTAETAKYDSAWLAEYVNEQCGKTYNASAIRVLLRKLREKIGREVGVDKSRYDFSGPNDPTVKMVIKAVKEGVLDQARKEALDALKEKAAAKKAAAAEAPAKKTGKKAAKAAPVEDDEDEDEVEIPAPRKKATRRRG